VVREVISVGTALTLSMGIRDPLVQEEKEGEAAEGTGAEADQGEGMTGGIGIRGSLAFCWTVALLYMMC